MGGYEKGGKGEDIPKEPSAIEQMLKMAKVIGAELHDAVTGKAGVAGYAMVMMIVIMLAVMIGLLSIFLLPAKNKSKRS